MDANVKVVRLVALAAAFALLATASLAAQSRGGVGRPGTSIRAMPIRPGSRVGTPLNPNFAPIGTVPGLSFNIQALAAADRRNLRRGRGEPVTPFLWYSPYYSPDLGYYEEPPQPPYDYSSAQPPSGAPYEQPSEAASAPAEAELQPPPRDVGQFVLVRLDGQVVFASAFTVLNGRVTYVTSEGVRRSFPASELDKDATREMNEANGTEISLPD